MPNCVTPNYIGRCAGRPAAIPGTTERLREVYLAEWTAFEPLDRCQELLERLKPLWLFHMEHARLLTAWHQKLGWRPLLPYTAAEWSVRSEQGALAVQLQKLLAG